MLVVTEENQGKILIQDGHTWGSLEQEMLVLADAYGRAD